MSTNEGSKSNKKDPLREHELAKKLFQDGKPVDYICIKGYVGKSNSDDLVRIYLNLLFNEYVEVKKSDIIHAEETEDVEYSGSCIWVRKEAEIIRVKIDSTKQQAQFMEGEIAQAQLKPTAITEGVRDLRPIPISLNPVFCPPPSPGIACFPSALLPCESRQILCPVQTTNTCGIICRPTLVRTALRCCFRPTREFLCDPSAIDACPTLRGCPSIANNCPSALVCNDPFDPIIDDPIIQLKSEMDKLRAKIKKLEEEKA